MMIVVLMLLGVVVGECFVIMMKDVEVMGLLEVIVDYVVVVVIGVVVGGGG